MQTRIRQIVFLLLIAGVFAWPSVTSSFALAAGLFVGVLLGNPFPTQSKAYTPKLLSYAIIGLGAGMNLNQALSVGLSGFFYTALGIVFTLLLGLGIGRLFKQSATLSLLISVGTAICGGSAIASVAPVIRAKSEEISAALGIVFLLNAIALYLFPVIGRALALSQPEFGLWAALAIHDTSSVVGATLAYGDEALRIGTTVKLARALWIIPVTLGVSLIWERLRKSEGGTDDVQPRKYPWFILGFLLTAALNTWVPGFSIVSAPIEFFAKRLMVLPLFLIGSNINLQILKKLVRRPILQGLLLWVVIATFSLLCVRYSIFTPV